MANINTGLSNTQIVRSLANGNKILDVSSEGHIILPSTDPSGNQAISLTYADGRYVPIAHESNKSNPHSVTKSQVGLGNVQNVDTTNASNISSGTIPIGRIPTGIGSSQVALGNHNHNSTYLQLSGGTLTGSLSLKGDQFVANGVAGLHAKNSDIIGLNGLFFSDAVDSAGEGLEFYTKTVDGTPNYGGLYIDSSNSLKLSMGDTASSRGQIFTIMQGGTSSYSKGALYSQGSKVATDSQISDVLIEMSNNAIYPMFLSSVAAWPSKLTQLSASSSATTVTISSGQSACFYQYTGYSSGSISVDNLSDFTVSMGGSYPCFYTGLIVLPDYNGSMAGSQYRWMLISSDGLTILDGGLSQKSLVLSVSKPNSFRYNLRTLL